ncbi:hypothetical protein NQ315_016248 [Exocentrus adspersus]|uniref:DDE Tnp4 domain-containing protein n=1 Tax=Exocentrus adspersus TaxID=1586481 RepID=A0AAV8VJ01_9CUCU|nr:hypothetical protein NQ315_016248 [Exocentrus adspersus]
MTLFWDYTTCLVCVKIDLNVAKLVSSNLNIFDQEKDHIKNILKENAYPEGFVEKTLLQIENPPNNNQYRQNPTSNMTIPYIPRISERLKRLGNEFNIRTTFKTNNTLRSILTHTKPKNKDQNEKNCIYKIPCQCGKHYIGETSRPLDVRVKEHKNYVRDYQVDRSHLAKHVWDNGHQINWKQASIIQKEPNFGKRKLKESACIKLNGGVIPEQCHLMYIATTAYKTLGFTGDPIQDSPESRFNTALSRVRVIIEHINGLLKARFRSIHGHRALHYNLARCAKIIYSCAVIHNMCRQFNVPVPLDEDDLPIPPRPLIVPPEAAVSCGTISF